jgi:glycosyltransferase involved in cell wall biosynthesis
MAEKYAGVTVIHNKENQYLAAALNTGISAAKGKYIVPLDADNMLGDNCLPVLADALDKNLGIDIAYGSMSVIEESGKEWTSSWPQEFNFGQQLGHHNQVPSTAMYRKKMWQRVGGYRSRCKTAEDADFWCRMTSYGAQAHKVTDMVVLHYRDRHDSMSHTIADWPWEKWYPWHRDVSVAPPISPMGGPVWTYEPVKISVIIPVGPGHTKYVVDAVDSLVAQDYRNWECIVVNDSGTPLPWIHPFVRVIDAGNGSGPAHARNVGIEMARAKLVIPLDADDYLQPSALKELYNAWNKVGGYVYSDWVIQETGEIKESEDYDPQRLLAHLPHAVTAIYPKEAWKKVGGFDEKLNAWEDWDFVLGLCDKGYCGSRLPVPLVQYRIHAGNRREELYAQRTTLIENIRTKWTKYFTGGAPMPCGSCGGKSVPLTAQQTQQFNAMAPSNNGGENLVLLEYIGRESGPMMFRGQVTGAQYRFGLDPSHRLKYVHKDDAEHLLARREFQLGKAPQELLQAAGRT